MEFLEIIYYDEDSSISIDRFKKKAIGKVKRLSNIGSSEGDRNLTVFFIQVFIKTVEQKRKFKFRIIDL